jgi:hypothetical protein
MCSRMSPHKAGAAGASVSLCASASRIASTDICISREWPFEPPRS